MDEQNTIVKQTTPQPTVPEGIFKVLNIFIAIALFLSGVAFTFLFTIVFPIVMRSEIGEFAPLWYTFSFFVISIFIGPFMITSSINLIKLKKTGIYLLATTTFVSACLYIFNILTDYSLFQMDSKEVLYWIIGGIIVTAYYWLNIKRFK